MPAATEQPAAAKKEREELLWQSLKEHVMRERQKIKEGKVQFDRSPVFTHFKWNLSNLSVWIVAEQEAEVEEERLRREREERDRQDAMTLGETKEQIQILNTRLKELRNEKQQLFMRLKKVFNEDEKRKKQQQQKERYISNGPNVGIYDSFLKMNLNQHFVCFSHSQWDVCNATEYGTAARVTSADLHATSCTTSHAKGQ